MKPYITLFRMEMLAWLRVKINLFFIIAWPVLWLLMMALVIPGADKGSPKDFLLFYFPSCMALVTLSTMISLAIRIALKKEARVLQRLRVVPFPISAYFVVQFLCSTVMSLLGLVSIALIAVALRMDPKGSLLSLGFVFLLGSFTFSVVGFFIAGVSRRVSTANILSMLVMFFMMFLSDMFIPMADMDSIVFKVGKWLPAQPFLSVARGMLMSGTRLWDCPLELSVLSAWGLAGVVLSLFTFKYDSK